MNTKIVSVVVCALCSLAAFGADLNQVIVVGTSVDAVKQIAAVELSDGLASVKRDGNKTVTLNLNDAGEYRVHQLLANGGAYNFAFDDHGAIRRVEWLNQFGPYRAPVATRGHIQVDSLTDVVIDGVILDLGKNTATFGLRQRPDACRAQNLTPIQKAKRCGPSGEPAMSLVLDLTGEADQKAYEEILHDGNMFGALSLTFDAKGGLSTMRFQWQGC